MASNQIARGYSAQAQVAINAKRSPQSRWQIRKIRTSAARLQAILNSRITTADAAL